MIHAYEEKAYESGRQSIILSAGIAAANACSKALAAGASVIALRRRPLPDTQDLNVPCCMFEARGIEAFSRFSHLLEGAPIGLRPPRRTPARSIPSAPPRATRPRALPRSPLAAREAGPSPTATNAAHRQVKLPPRVAGFDARLWLSNEWFCTLTHNYERVEADERG
jgi:hypothetical protein